MLRWAAVFVFVIVLFGGMSVLSAADSPDRPFELSVSAEKETKEKGRVVLRVTPKAGHKINKEFPIRLKAALPEGVTMAKTEFSTEDAAVLKAEELVFRLPYQVKPDAAPKKTWTATFRFGTCEMKNGQVASCRMHRESLSVVLPD